MEPTLPDLPSTIELSLRIVFAAFLGAMIGLERELNDHPSGLRTHIAVSMGAALFGLVSAYAFTEFIALRESNNYQVDVTRVASQVVAGVGFLGAGAIVKQGNTVRGLTSAAGLWVSAAVGLAVSLGLYVESVVTTVTLIVSLVLLRGPRRWIRRRMVSVRENVEITMDGNADASGVISALGNLADTVIHSIVVKRREEEGVLLIEAEIESRGTAQLLQNRLASIESRPDVQEIEIG